ncbi:MAG: hypothetical protein Q4D26_12505 [Clostridia bacterium]|nr:hypothetical protein [Clostridia bacterium]
MKTKLIFFRIFISIFIVMVICYILGYMLYITQVDVKCVEKLEEALVSYDIKSLDECLADDVDICYNNECRTYISCRKNILANMEKKNYKLTMYGGGDNKFKNNIQEINTQVYGTFNGENYGESNILVYLKRTGFKSFKIIRLESNDEILNKLFF